MEGFEGDVRLVFKRFPLPGHPERAARGAHGLGGAAAGEFWEAHDWLFEQRGSIDELPSFTEDAGLDPDRLGRDMQSEASSEAVDDDRIIAGERGHPRDAWIRRERSHLRRAPHRGAVDQDHRGRARRRPRSRRRGDGPGRRLPSALMKDALKKRGPGPLPSVDAVPGNQNPNEHYRVEAGEGSRHAAARAARDHRGVRRTFTARFARRRPRRSSGWSRRVPRGGCAAGVPTSPPPHAPPGAGGPRGGLPRGASPGQVLGDARRHLRPPGQVGRGSR